MADLKELASSLCASEQGLGEAYRSLYDSAVGEAEKKLAKQLADFQRFQVLGLEMLCEGVPDQFLGFGRITADDVNLREGPGSRYALIDKISEGELVIIQGFNGLWVQVQVPRGKRGYVFKDYVLQETR